MESNTCSNIDCKKQSTLQCPTCLDQGLSPTYFCSQDCFKKCWTDHKKLHLIVPLYFKDFKFTGTLRPGNISHMRQVPNNIERPDYAETGEPIGERLIKSTSMIDIKTPNQIEKMRRVCRLAREVLDIAGKAAQVGITTDEIDKIVHNATIDRGAYPSPLNYRGFPKSCCTSVNEVICHGIPDSRQLQNGDILNIDITVYYDGYHGDVNETYLIGDVNDDTKKLVNTTYEALEKAIDIVKPGTLYRDIGTVISKYINRTSFSIVRNYCGHGIGKLFHTIPNIPHYDKNKTVGVMKPGHIFTIEPMINMGTYRDCLWPDKWTSTTLDGKPSAQFEHTILVTQTGYEILTAKIN